MNKLIKLYNQGASRKKIASGAGVPLSSVSRLIREARERGDIPPKKPADPEIKLANTLKKACITKGTISRMLLMLPADAQHWVMNNTPEGSTVAEFAAAVLMDAFYEEMGEDQ